MTVPQYPLHQRIPSAEERDAVRDVLRGFGFRRSWVLDNPDRGEFVFFVEAKSLSRELDWAIERALRDALPHRKAIAVPYLASAPHEPFFDDEQQPDS